MSAASPRQLWLLPVLLITVIATAVGALVARSVYAEQPPAPPPAVQPSASPARVPLGEQPGPSEVQGTADATASPLYGTVRPLLQKVFDAINAKDYDLWASTVTDERRLEKPEEEWQEDFGSSRDGSIVIYRIEASGDGTALVLLHFTSTQEPGDAPKELQVGCINWHVVWPVALEDGEWKLAAGITGATPRIAECPT